MKEDLVPDEVSQSLILTPQDTARITHRIVMTKGAYPSTSFIIDHPVYGYIDSPTLAIDGGYLDADLSSGLIAFYNCFGNANDATGNSHNGTVTGATLTTDFEGRPSNAYEFDANTEKIIIPHSSSFATSTVTLSAWVYPDSSPTEDGYIVAKYGTTTADRSYLMYRYQTTIRFYTSNGVYLASTTGALPYKTWTHVVCTYDGTTSRVYINGSLASTPTVKAYNSTGTTEVSIGNGATGISSSFFGKVTAVGWWNRALSDTEISRLYMGGYINDYPLKDGELVSVTQL
jgi:hypothetical protein